MGLRPPLATVGFGRGPSVASAARVIAAGHKHKDTVFMVAENSQYWHEVVTAQRLIAQGAIGKVMTVSSGIWTVFAYVRMYYQIYKI